MILGKVVGTVVSSIRADGFEGVRYLLVDKTTQHGEPKNDYLVALDMIGVNHGELVLISESTSARETLFTTNKPVDALIVGIVDLIDEYEKIVYNKV